MIHDDLLYIVTTKDKRPPCEELEYATKTPEGYLLHRYREGKNLLNERTADLFVFLVTVPKNVTIEESEKLVAEHPHALDAGLVKIAEPERVRLIKHGKWRFYKDPLEIVSFVREDGVTKEYPIFAEGLRLS